MQSDSSVIQWIATVQAGDETTAARIWQRYFPDLIRVAHQRLQGTSRRVSDEEDVALSALDSFFRAVRKDRFPDLSDSNELWRLLSEMTRRKAVDLIRRNQRLRAGGGNARGDSAFLTESGESGFDQVPSDDPTPQLAAELAENCQRLIESLGDPSLQRIALAKMEGFTNAEIAVQIACTERTVERRLKLIRLKWEQTNE